MLGLFKIVIEKVGGERISVTCGTFFPLSLIL